MSRAFCSFFRHDGGDRAPIGGPFLLSAGARRRRVGVKVERPQAKPRTNDLDAGEERRRLLQEEAAVRPSKGPYRCHGGGRAVQTDEVPGLLPDFAQLLHERLAHEHCQPVAAASPRRAATFWTRPYATP